MAILGINYTKLDIEAKNKPYANLSINTTPKIEAVNKTQIQTGKNAIPILVVDFSFNSSFTPEIGQINLNGNIVFQPKNEEASMAEWTKNNKLPPEEEAEIINYLFVKVTPFALFLSEVFRLPPIIALPKMELKKEEVKKKEAAKETKKSKKK
ncbi:MAG: hypothetical protein DRN66_02930 [Candidatus Nanohalarchaeota archaeon]|nr:MAG: hypothetical protein DRN66_02930 [Candidatus Nanohaloarchaeota archaeon]